MRRPDAIYAERIAVVLHSDPLSPWCYIAERRIAAALEEMGEAFAPLAQEPFALQTEARCPSSSERRRLAREVRRAAREPEGRALSPELWRSADSPTSSLPPLAALAAARAQGAEWRFRADLVAAALERGVNVARTDVLLELAARAGLDVESFAVALADPATTRQLIKARRAAVDRGIAELPALVIGDEWLIAGLRSGEEYRSLFWRYLQSPRGVPHLRLVH